MRSVTIILSLAIAGLCVAATPALAGDGPGTKVVRAANDTISGLLKKKATPDKVTESVRGFLDIDELGKRALVDQWDKLTDKQKTDFLTLLRSLIENSYAKGLKANLDYKVSYLGEAAGTQKGTIVVKTQIEAKKKGRPIKIAVDYVLVDQGGKLKAFDVATDGVGLVDNYRSQFNKIIAKDGIDGLIAKMKKKTASPP